jgi:hypothetical protein
MNYAAAFRGATVVHYNLSLKGNSHASKGILNEQVIRTTRGTEMLLLLAIVLLVLWFLGFVAFHVTTGLIHFVLVVALIMFVLHMVSGRRASI